MTCEELIPIMRNVDIRNAIADIAAGFTRDVSIQKTLSTKAWITISENPAGYTTESYIGIAYGIMRHVWEIYYMPEPNGRPSHSASNQRAIKRLKKFVKIKA